MKSISSTVVLSAVLLASLSASPTDAWSSSTAVHQKIIHPNKNARIIATPHKVMSTVVTTRSTITLSATTNNNSFSSSTLKSASSSTTLGVKAKRMISNLLRFRTFLLHQFSTVTAPLTHKFKVVMLSTMLAITTLLPPQCAIAKSNLFSLSSGAKDTSSSSIVAPSSSGGSRSSGMKKVGKVVVTIGAVGAGASTANAMRGKFACSNDNEKEGEGEDDEESAPVNGKKENESAATNGSSVQPTATTTTKNNGTVNKNKAEIEPLSEEWIQQQLNDAEKRSNVLNDAIKMTQQSSRAPPPAVVTKPSTKVNGSKKMSVGNTIGIPSNKSTNTPLVKNLDSKIQMLQQRDAERTKQQLRDAEQQAQVELEARQVAIVEAKQKIEAAEREYRKSQQLQQQEQQEQQEVEQSVVAVKEVEEVDATPTSATTATATTTTTSTRLAIKTGPGGTPAKSKEEDLELTTQVILEYVNSIDGRSGGGVVDDDE